MAFFMHRRGGGVQRPGRQRPGIRQHRQPAFSVAEVAPLFFAEQVPPEAKTSGMSQASDSQLTETAP